MNKITAGEILRGKDNGGVACLRRDPGAIGLGRATGDANPPSAQRKEKQDAKGDQAPQRPDFFGEEIGGPSDLEVRLNKLFPG